MTDNTHTDGEPSGDFIILWHQLGGCSYCLIRHMNPTVGKPCFYHGVVE